MDKIILWLQRNVKVSVASLILTMLTAWFAYDQYLVLHGGTITSVLYNTELVLTNKTFIICKTQDSIHALYPQILPRIRNNSKYTLNHLKIKQVVITPYEHNYLFSYDIDPKYTFNGDKIDATPQSKKTEFYYKEDAFYPTDETPDLFMNLDFIPDTNESLVRYFDIETTVSWDANDPIEYKTRVFYKTYKDNSDIIQTDSLLRIRKNVTLSNWCKVCAEDMKRRAGDINDFDVVFYYHYQADSLSSKGAFSHLRSLSIASLDSLQRDYSDNNSFLEDHLYKVENEPRAIHIPISRWIVLILLNSVLLICLIIHFSISIQDYKQDAPNHLLVACVCNMLLVITGVVINIIYHYELIPIPMIHFFDSIGYILFCISTFAIISYWIQRYKVYLKQKNLFELIWPVCYLLFVAAYTFSAFLEHSLL